MDKSMQNQNQDIEKLRIAAQLVLDFYDELNGLKEPKRNNIPISLFRALATLTLKLAKPDVALKDIWFNPKELREKTLEIWGKNKSKDEDSEWIRKNWHDLEDDLEKYRKSHLQEFSERKGEKFYPWIEKDESKGGEGNSSRYYLIVRVFNEQEKIETKQYDCPEGGLHYVQESLTNMPRWARWIDGFTLQGWRRYAYILLVLFGVIILLLLLAVICLTLIQGIYTQISIVKWLTYLIVSLGVGSWVLSAPLYRLAPNKIVMASDWMTPLKESNVQLELKKVGTDSETGKAIRELRLVIYSAKCPICEGRVEVEGGGIQFPFRLVGKCIESPREHIFSFDHVTRIGKPL
jgi:hypothetical protein